MKAKSTHGFRIIEYLYLLTDTFYDSKTRTAVLMFLFHGLAWEEKKAKMKARLTMPSRSMSTEALGAEEAWHSAPSLQRISKYKEVRSILIYRKQT